MMKITGLSHLIKWEKLHNWWLTKYFFAPLYCLLHLENKAIWINLVGIRCNNDLIQKYVFFVKEETLNKIITIVTVGLINLDSTGWPKE